MLGGAAVSWPLAARAQQGDRIRRIGVLMGFAENDQNWQARLTALRTVLQERGWTDGRNVRFDVRWTPPVRRSGHCGFYAEPCSSRRQYYWIYFVRALNQHQIFATTKGHLTLNEPRRHYPVAKLGMAR